MANFKRIKIESERNEYSLRPSGKDQIASVEGMEFTCTADYPFKAPSIKVAGNYKDSDEFHFSPYSDSMMMKEVSMDIKWSPRMNIQTLIYMLNDLRV